MAQGGDSSGVLYVLYTMSALTVAAGLVQRTGAKMALAIGLALYCFYTGSFLVASEAPSAEWYAAITGSTVGGFAAGWLWTAQGAFFARTAQLYAQASNQDISKVCGIDHASHTLTLCSCHGCDVMCCAVLWYLHQTLKPIACSGERLFGRYLFHCIRRSRSVMQRPKFAAAPLGW
jgi:hypothetical protein